MLALYLRIYEKHFETKCVSGQLQGVAMLRRALAATNNSCVTPKIGIEASERKLQKRFWITLRAGLRLKVTLRSL